MATDPEASSVDDRRRCIGPDPGGAKRASKKTRRQRRTFSGCSTCRARKIKCDEVGWPCERCKKARVPCEGYPGYRSEVLWKPVQSLSTFQAVSGGSNTDRVAQLFSHVPPQTTSVPTDSTTEHRDVVQSSMTRHLDLLPDLPVQTKLIDHWISHLSDALMPLPGPRNPLKIIFVPIAYTGARSNNTESSGSVALFYLICASSAFNLSLNLTDKQESAKYSTLALSHHSKGLRHLQHVLSDLNSDKEAVLASLLLCVMYEPITVDPQCWRIHIQGALQWLEKVDVDKVASKNLSSRMLCQMLILHAMLLRTQFERDSVLHQCIARLLRSDALKPYMLYELEGLPETTFDIIGQAIHASFQPRSELDERQLDMLELEAKLNMPHSNACEHTTETDQSMHDRLLSHHAHAYYLSTQVYLLRTLRHHDACTSQIQILVTQCLEHLEAMENCTKLRFCPIVWPVMITCFEATDEQLQARALACVEFFAQHSTLMIWHRARVLLKQFWAEREASEHRDIQWQAFLNRPDVPGMMMV